MGGVIVKGDGLETRGRRMEKACHMRNGRWGGGQGNKQRHSSEMRTGEDVEDKTGERNWGRSRFL